MNIRQEISEFGFISFVIHKMRHSQHASRLLFYELLALLENLSYHGLITGLKAEKNKFKQIINSQDE